MKNNEKLSSVNFINKYLVVKREQLIMDLVKVNLALKG